MPVTDEYQLFDFDSIADGLVAAVALGTSPAQALGKYNTVTSETPRVYITFTVGSARQNKHILVPSLRADLQPYNAFDFTLSAEVTTQREQNGQLHNQLIAKTRLALQLYKLLWFGRMNPHFWPHHTIRDIAELQPNQLVVDDGNTTDTTTLNFQGWFEIDPNAWPNNRPEPADGVNALVSGAGTSFANGTYERTEGLGDGRYVYQKPSPNSASPDEITWGGGVWEIRVYLDEGGGQETCYRATSNALTPFGLTWTVQPPGESPAPTVSQN